MACLKVLGFNLDADLTLRLIELNNYTRGVKNMANLYISMYQIVIIIKDCSTSDNSKQMLAQIEMVRKLKRKYKKPN